MQNKNRIILFVFVLIIAFCFILSIKKTEKQEYTPPEPITEPTPSTPIDPLVDQKG